MKKLLLIATLLLTACATPEQLAEQRRLQEQEDFKTCRAYGLRPGSEAFGNCRLQLDIERNRHYYHDYNERPRLRTGIGYYHYR